MKPIKMNKTYVNKKKKQEEGKKKGQGRKMGTIVLHCIDLMNDLTDRQSVMEVGSGSR